MGYLRGDTGKRHGEQEAKRPTGEGSPIKIILSVKKVVDLSLAGRNSYLQ